MQRQLLIELQVPVIKDDGSVAGIINSTFGMRIILKRLTKLPTNLFHAETTSKVITERWMLCLRDLANNAGLAKTQTEFASAVMNVLNAFTLEYVITYRVYFIDCYC